MDRLVSAELVGDGPVGLTSRREAWDVEENGAWALGGWELEVVEEERSRRCRKEETRERLLGVSGKTMVRPVEVGDLMIATLTFG